MGPRQEAGLGDDLPDRPGVTAVDPRPGLQDRATNDIGFLALDQAADKNAVILLAEFFLDLGANLAKRRLAFGLVGDLIGGGEFLVEAVDHSLNLGRVCRLLGKRARLLGTVLGKFDDGVENRLHRVMAEIDSPEHDLLGQFLGFGFDHQHAFMRTGNNEVEVGFLHLRHGRVENIGVVNPANTSRRDRAEERHAGQAQGRRRANHRGDIGVVLHVMRQHGTDHLRLAFEGGWEQRPDRTVDQAADQRFIFGRPAFALEEAARDLAGGKRLFLVINRQREKILSRPRAVRRHGGTEDGGLAEADHDRAIGLTGNLAGFQNKRGAVPVKLFAENLEHRCVSLSSSQCRTRETNLTAAQAVHGRASATGNWSVDVPGGMTAARSAVSVLWAPAPSSMGPGVFVWSPVRRCCCMRPAKKQTRNIRAYTCHEKGPAALAAGPDFRRACPKVTRGLAAQPKAADQRLIRAFIALLDVVEKIAALADHRQQATARTEILLMSLQMLGQIDDPFGQDGDLHGRRARIRFRFAEFLDEFSLAFICNRHRNLLWFLLQHAGRRIRD